MAEHNISPGCRANSSDWISLARRSGAAVQQCGPETKFEALFSADASHALPVFGNRSATCTSGNGPHVNASQLGQELCFT